MATSRKSELPNQDPVRKPNKNCMIRTTDGTKTKTETSVTKDQQLADDSVSLDLQINLLSQIREAFTYVNEINERNRQIINKLDHFQNNSFDEQDLPNNGKEITHCEFQERNEVQCLMETDKRSDCARAIETADKLSSTLDAFCKCFQAQISLERRPTSASQSNSDKFDPLSVVFRSGLRRKHIYREDDNRVVLFLFGDIHQDRKSPSVVQAPNVSKVIHISRTKNPKADKLQQYLGSSKPTTTTNLTAATTKEGHSASTSTMQMTATALTTKPTTVGTTIKIATKEKPERATSQACPSAGNITGQLRRSQTNIRHDNRLVSYEAQVERRAYKPLDKNKNDGAFHAGSRQNRFNGFKYTGYQFVTDEKRVLMSEPIIPKEHMSSEQGSENPGDYRLGSQQTHIAEERVHSRNMLSSLDSMKIHTNANETRFAEDVGKGRKYDKRQASLPKQLKGIMDTQDRVCSSEIPKKCDSVEGNISKLWMKQTDTNSTESAITSTKKYNRQEADGRKMIREDSMSTSELSRAQGNSKDTFSTIDSSMNKNNDKSVRHTSELLKKESVTTDTLLAIKPPIKQGIATDKMSSSEVSKKQHDDIKKSNSKPLTKYIDSKGTVSTSDLSANITQAEETAFAMELSKTRVATGDGIPPSQRSKEDKPGKSKSNSSIKPTGIMIDSAQGKSLNEASKHYTHRSHQVTVKNPAEIAPREQEEAAQGLDLMPFVQQYWGMCSGNSDIGTQLDAVGMKMELLNPDDNDPSKPLKFKYKLENLGLEQIVEVKMSDMLALQNQVGSQPLQSLSFVDLNYWPKFCEEEVQKGKRYRIDDDSIDTVLCIDISSSMKGEAWGQAMDFAKNFVRGIKANPPINVGVQEKIALVTFGHMTKIHKHLTTDYDGILRLIDHLYPDGPSPMGPGLLLCASAIEACGKTLLMQGLTVFPRIIMITDGIPTSAIMLKGPDITVVENLEQTNVEVIISASRVQVDFQLFCVPVGDSRLDFLKTISKCTGGKVVNAGNWKKLVRWSRNLNVASRYIDSFKRSESTVFFERLQKENSHLSSRELGEIRKLLKESKDMGVNTSIKKQLFSVAADNGNGQLDIPIGTRVRRGPDWSRGDEDGYGPGTVIGKTSANGQLQIVWDWSKSRRNIHIYRYGQDIIEIVPVNEPRILSTGENMAVGCYVERGRDWKHGNEDGGPGNIGVVTYFDTQTEIVDVIWPNGGVFIYKFGNNGRFEIRVRNGLSKPGSRL
ncbi:hypothetical protein CHS0354_037908 [Potamilus streckersoni]|uniref:Uncharacterized protein n=1 Tax=Potamilus streckersoni TaxID=2493646 RepID=A0AAE0T9I6_9BIVA|nr:hypothetical protein CHS0354_037908 [Potamilus streckersoni]